MLGVDNFLKKFKDQRKESDRVIVCGIDKEKSFDVCFWFGAGEKLNKFTSRIENDS